MADKPSYQKGGQSKTVTVKPVQSVSGGLEGRGNKPTSSQRANQAREILSTKGEKSYEAQMEARYTGMRGPKEGMMRGPSASNQAQIAKLKQAAKPIVKIDTNPVPTRTSGLSGVSGKLGGQHAGGHGASLGGMPGMDLGGGGGFGRENM